MVTGVIFLLFTSSLFSRVSSVLNRDSSQYGKKFMFDKHEDTCWNSDQVIYSYGVNLFSDWENRERMEWSTFSQSETNNKPILFSKFKFNWVCFEWGTGYWHGNSEQSSARKISILNLQYRSKVSYLGDGLRIHCTYSFLTFACNAIA